MHAPPARARPRLCHPPPPSPAPHPLLTLFFPHPPPPSASCRRVAGRRRAVASVLHKPHAVANHGAGGVHCVPPQPQKAAAVRPDPGGAVPWRAAALRPPIPAPRVVAEPPGAGGQWVSGPVGLSAAGDASADILVLLHSKHPAAAAAATRRRRSERRPWKEPQQRRRQGALAPARSPKRTSPWPQSASA